MTIWIAVLIFEWLNVRPTLWIAGIIGGTQLLNDLRRTSVALEWLRAIEGTRAVSGLLGIIAGAMWFL